MKEIFNEYYTPPTWIQWLIMLLFLAILLTLFLIAWKIKEKYYPQSKNSKEDIIIYRGIIGLTIVFLIALSILFSYIFSSNILVSYYNAKQEIPAQVNNNDITIITQSYVESLGINYLDHCQSNQENIQNSILCGGNKTNKIKLINNEGYLLTLDFKNSYDYKEHLYVLNVVKE